MNWFKRHPWFAIALSLCGCALFAEAWLWWDGDAQAKKAIAALKQKTQERDWLASQSPAPSKENAAKISGDVTAIQKNIAALRSALAGHEGAALLATPVPGKAIDGYFDIAGFVERTRTLAGRAQVIIKADERFGFSTHANEGPEPDLLAPVFRQRLLAQFLVEALIEARPRAFLGLQRERPLTAATRAARNQRADSSAAPLASQRDSRTAPTLNRPASEQETDFFELDPTLSVRVTGEVESEAFRVEFTGQTPSLRAFMNTLAEFRVPVVVRRVDVEPLRGEISAVAPPDPHAPVPLVPQNFSKFVVVVEFILPVARTEQPVL